MQSSKNGNNYRAFGLNINCNIPLSDNHGMVSTNEEHSDVFIYQGDVPDSLDNTVYTDKYIAITKDKLLLKINNVAKYLIIDGKEIIVEPEKDANYKDVATFVFGTCIGTILHQRGIIPIHGSSIRTEKGAFLFTGEQGVGKSTTAAALAKRGWEFIADDICAIHIIDGIPYIYPGLMRAKLCTESFSMIEGNMPSGEPIVPLSNKYGLSFESNLKPAKFSTLCLLEKGEYIKTEKVIGAAKFSLLMSNVYRPYIHHFTNLPQDCFESCSTICKNIDILKITRDNDINNMCKFIDEIETLLMND